LIYGGVVARSKVDGMRNE